MPDQYWAATQSGKFIVMLHKNHLHVVFSSIDLTPYHADIVCKYLLDNHLAEVESMGRGQCEILDAGWEILGGGLFLFHPQDKTLSFMEKSTAYGKYPIGMLEKMKPEILKGLKLEEYTLNLL